jgi:glucose-6-phosphate isomerase
MFEALKAHHATVTDRSILSLFDASRAADFSVRACDMLFDWSKTNIDADGRRLLLDLCDRADLAARRDAMFSGAKINETEGRAVLHTALRSPPDARILVDGADVMPEVVATRRRMAAFAADLRSGKVTTPGGRPITDVVNIGIGGSDLGPAMACIALSPYADGPRCHFVSNVDGAQVAEVLKGLDPSTTLAIIASKTFTTIETMTNAATVRDWLSAKVGSEAVGGHLCALSSNLKATAEWGIDPARVFGFEDWVGGRYSMWGPIGLSVMLAVGPDNFRAFCMGGAEMDAHFRTAPWAQNMPVILALVGLWHNQICGYATRAVLPYEQRLARLPAYLQQLEMESNGKRVAMDGSTLPFDSGPVVWGEPGTNGQHAFYQLIHQGTRPIPCEFMVGKRGHEPHLAHQHLLLACNCLAQSEALLRGRSLDEATAIMAKKGLSGAELDRQARHRVFPGNRPSTTLVYDLLDPATLGRIVALYEHRVFVEGVILGINSFDQWGVELGKELATALGPLLEGRKGTEGKDGSTAMLVAELRS